MSAKELPYKDCAIATPLTPSDFNERQRSGAKNLFRIDDDDIGAALIAFDNGLSSAEKDLRPLDLDKLRSEELIVITDPEEVLKLRIKFNVVTKAAQETVCAEK